MHVELPQGDTHKTIDMELILREAPVLHVLQSHEEEARGERPGEERDEGMRRAGQRVLQREAKWRHGR